MVGTNRESFSNSLSFQKKATGTKTFSTLAKKWTLELDKIYGLRFSNLFISLFVNTGARTLSPTLVFALPPADRQGGKVWLNHIFFSRILPNINQTWWKWFSYCCSQKSKEKENQATHLVDKITRESAIAGVSALQGVSRVAQAFHMASSLHWLSMALIASCTWGFYDFCHGRRNHSLFWRLKWEF